MPRPKTKSELLTLGKKNYQKLLQHIDSYLPEEQIAEFPAGTLNRNIRDVLGHLHHWHLMCLGWNAEAVAGRKPVLPAPGYTWKTTPELNQMIQEKYSIVPLEKVKALLNDSYEQIRALIEHHSEKELFEKRHFSWTGSTSLGAYLISASSSHYDWAYKLIRRCKKV